MSILTIKKFGQITKADIKFGDMTILIGPQASGKSIFLQLFKLINDHSAILKVLKRQGFDWKKDKDRFAELYFGENMGDLWHVKTEVKYKSRSISKVDIIRSTTKTTNEKVFYIPAQRVMTLDNGWPKPFNSFRVGDPFIVKNFSENLRLLLEAGLGSGEGPIFPQERRLKKHFRDHLDKSIFHGAEAVLDNSTLQRRIVLNVNSKKLPYMTWSAGQREFLPLLLGLYWLMPPRGETKKAEIDWIIIEEPEMGLHPKAIISFILITLELISRGYKVIISTHSPVIPQVAWAIRNMKDLNSKTDYMFELFQIDRNQQLNQIFTEILHQKIFNTYYFDMKSQTNIEVIDISTLDSNDENSNISDWGGLTQFSSTVTDVISKLYAENF